MAKDRMAPSLDDLNTVAPNTLNIDELNRKVIALEFQVQRQAQSKMVMTDSQLVYYSAYTSTLTGLMALVSNSSRRATALHSFLQEADRVARFAVQVYEGVNRPDFIKAYTQDLKNAEAKNV